MVSALAIPFVIVFLLEMAAVYAILFKTRRASVASAPILQYVLATVFFLMCATVSRLALYAEVLPTGTLRVLEFYFYAFALASLVPPSVLWRRFGTERRVVQIGRYIKEFYGEAS